ncbi:MAG: methionine--tRNA ligase [Planctomycetes bacterium]|nr:methionine--tRNA ligase [Planctomycetota bacterium]
MAKTPRYFITTAIDYPNSRPHIGTAFEKLGADVQARYRRMEGYDVHFLMGNDENTVKVARKAAELGKPPKEYCDDMARQFQDVWRALDISFDEFIQTSEPRHHAGCQKFIQKVYDAGYIYKGSYEGWYCDGCESFKTEKDLVNGNCPVHGTPAARRSEPCHYFALSKFQDKLIAFYEEYPDFIQPESRRNEVMTLVQTELRDVNITRLGQEWGIRVPFDPDFTIWVWFDALLNYITAIGYGGDEERFKKWWPAEMHVIGKDITRFHCALWPAMLMAAELDTPKRVFGHGFVYMKGEKISKTLGNIVEPMDIITKFSADAFRYYFLRECPFPGDGDFSWQRFEQLYNADLANNLGNLYSRVITLVTKNYGGHLEGTSVAKAGVIYTEVDTETTVKQVQEHFEACQYNQALERIWRQVLDPANQYADKKEPWKLVKTDLAAAKQVLHDLVEQLRIVSILLKPFLPRTGKTIYESFNFKQRWDEVRHEDVWVHPGLGEDLRILAELENGKVKPLFPRIA